jgi:hypothetical protein
LAVTEIVRKIELLHLTLTVYLAGNRNIKRNYSSLQNIAVDYFHLVARFGQTLFYVFGDHD